MQSSSTSLTCHGCLKVFSSHIAKLKHEKVQRFGDMFVCDPCDAVIYSQCEFQLHLTHGGDARLECDECLKTFSTKTTLKQFQLIHSKTKRFECTSS